MDTDMDQISKCLICYIDMTTLGNKYKFSTSLRSKNSQARVSQAICFVFHKPPDLIAQLNKIPDLCCSKCVKELLRISEIRDQLMELEEQLFFAKGNVEKKFLTIHQKIYEEGHGGSNSVSNFKLRWDLFNSKERDRNDDVEVEKVHDTDAIVDPSAQIDNQNQSNTDERNEIDIDPLEIDDVDSEIPSISKSPIDNNAEGISLTLPSIIEIINAKNDTSISTIKLEEPEKMPVEIKENNSGYVIDHTTITRTTTYDYDTDNKCETDLDDNEEVPRYKRKKNNDDSDNWEPADDIGRELIIEETPVFSENVDKEMKSECLKRKPLIILTRMEIANVNYQQEQGFNINNDWIQIFIKSENERIEKDKIKRNQKQKFFPLEKVVTSRVKDKLYKCRTKQKCRFCNIDFFDKYVLKKHILVKHSTNKPPKLPCSICKAMVTQSNLTGHMKRKHTVTIDEKSAQNNADVDILHCSICDRTLYDQGGLKRHMKIHEIRENVCLKCGKTYRTEDFLNAHIKRIHLDSSKGKSFCCEICGDRFLNKFTLKGHMRIKHQVGPPLLTCDQCGAQKFKSHSDLDIHIKKVHQGIEGPFKCHKENCSKSFFVPSNLETHLKSHEKFVCQICGKYYTSLLYLTIHTKQIHEKEYHHFCKFSGCNKGFYAKGCCSRHEKMHYISANFDGQCKFCLKKFSSPMALKIHELKHTVDESGFKCSLCELKFITKHLLKYHILYKHSEQGNCSKCGKNFPTQHNLNRHMKTCKLN